MHFLFREGSWVGSRVALFLVGIPCLVRAQAVGRLPSSGRRLWSFQPTSKGGRSEEPIWEILDHPGTGVLVLRAPGPWITAGEAGKCSLVSEHSLSRCKMEIITTPGFVVRLNKLVAIKGCVWHLAYNKCLIQGRFLANSAESEKSAVAPAWLSFPLLVEWRCMRRADKTC